MISPKNVVRHELIGLEAEVVGSSHEGCIGMKGVIVDETRNTLTLDSKGLKTLPKNCVVLRILLPGGQVVEIDGDVLVARPEDRIVKKFR